MCTTSNITFQSIMQLQAASDVYSPVSGEVTEVNEALNDSPDLVCATTVT